MTPEFDMSDEQAAALSAKVGPCPACAVPRAILGNLTHVVLSQHNVPDYLWPFVPRVPLLGVVCMECGAVSFYAAKLVCPEAVHEPV